VSVPVLPDVGPEASQSVRLLGPTGEADHPHGGKIAVNYHRLSRLTGSGPIASRDFGKEIVLVCIEAGGKFLSVTTKDFVTEILDSELKTSFGPPIDEKHLFDANPPDETSDIQFSEDGTTVLIESKFWDPPYRLTRWLTAWDVATGLWRTDRMRMVDDGMTSYAETAQLSSNGTSICLKRNEIQVRQIQLAVPDDVKGWLPDFAEAVGGVVLDANNIPGPVERRHQILSMGLAELDGLTNHQSGGTVAAPVDIGRLGLLGSTSNDNLRLA